MYVYRVTGRNYVDRADGAVVLADATVASH